MLRASRTLRLVASCLLASGALAAAVTPARADVLIGQGLVQGGISTDASAIFTPGGDDSATFFSGPDLIVAMPEDAVVVSAHLLVAAQYNGYENASAVADNVRLAGVLLSSATLVDEGFGTLPYQLYDVTEGFGIDAAGTYTIEETAAAEGNAGSYYGITGHQLIVQWTSPTAPWTYSHVWVGHAFSGQAIPLVGPEACAASQGSILSLGVGWECSSEQNNTVVVSDGLQSLTISTTVGGGDDAGAPTPCDGNGAALYTAGSFGADDAGPVGVDGDDWLTEPAGGDTSNNRISDELFGFGPPAFALDESADLTLSGDENEAVHVVVLLSDAGADFDCDGTINDDDLCPGLDAAQQDLDTDGIGDDCDDDDDGDGVDDGVDNCPVDPNPGQEDGDDDGIGDACDPTGSGGGGGAGGAGGSTSGDGGAGGSGTTSGEGGTTSGDGGASSGDGGAGGTSSGDGGAPPGEGGGAPSPTSSSTGSGPQGATTGTSGSTASAGGDDGGSSGASADDGGCAVGVPGRERDTGTATLLALLAAAAVVVRRRTR